MIHDNEILEQEARRLFIQYGGRKLTPRERLSIPAQEMPAQQPQVRVNNMDEVALGYSENQVRVEAMRCLQCANAPCVKGCPVQIDIPGFLAKAADGDYAGSIAVIKKNSMLPSVCGRVCPQESQCQEFCTVGRSHKDVNQAVAIGRVERYVADWEAANGQRSVPEVAPPTGKKVGVIGSGPASMTAAADLRRAGHEVVMFEALHKAGGSPGLWNTRIPSSQKNSTGRIGHTDKHGSPY